MSERGWLEAKERLEARRAEATPQAGILREDVWAALDEIKRLKQMMWDAYGILGFDRDGDETPDACVGWPHGFLAAVREARSAADAAQRDAQEQREQLVQVSVMLWAAGGVGGAVLEQAQASARARQVIERARKIAGATLAAQPAGK